MDESQLSFKQFSDQLRFEESKLANLSLNDSIWSPYYTKRMHERRNFDVRSTEPTSGKNPNLNDLNFYGVGAGQKLNDLNSSCFNEGWKIMQKPNDAIFSSFDDGWQNFGFGDRINKEICSYPKFGTFNNNGRYMNCLDDDNGGKTVKKNGNKKISGDNLDKKLRSLPPSESLPRNEPVGGYIFVCNNDTMEENLRRQLFGLPSRYRDSVRAITPGLPLFLYNYSTHQLHGIYEASSFGGTNIDPTAWEDKKCPGESRFPSQVRIVTRKLCNPLEEDSFRPVLHHYDGPKFRLELNVPEALDLLDIFNKRNR